MCAWLQSWKHGAEWLCASCLRGGCTSHLCNGLSWDEPRINLHKKHRETAPAPLPDSLRWDWGSLEAPHIIKIECVCINVQRTHWEDNVRPRCMSRHECRMNTQASTEGAKALYHEQDKQTEDVFYWFVRQINQIGKGEDATHKYS